MKESFFSVSMNEITRMFVVRHGTTDDSVEGRMSSRSKDISLNAEGIEQIKLLANRLNRYGISKIYSSPQRRACQTAEILNERLQVEIEFDSRLLEYDFGIISDLTFSEVSTYYPELYKKINVWINSFSGPNNQRILIPGAEPFDQLISRIQSFTGCVVNRHLGEKIISVTHGGFIKALLTHYAGGSIAEHHGRFMANTASISIVDFYNGIPCIQGFNDIAHLGFDEVRFGRPLVL